MEKRMVQTTVRLPEKLLEDYKAWLVRKRYSLNQHVRELIELTLAVEGKNEDQKPKDLKEKILKDLALELFFSDYEKNPFYRRGIADERKRIVKHLLRKEKYKSKKVEEFIEEVSNLLGISKAVAEKIVREARKELKHLSHQG